MRSEGRCLTWRYFVARALPSVKDAIQRRSARTTTSSHWPKTGIKTSNICSQSFAGACSTYLKIRKRSFDIDNIDNGSGAHEGGERVAASSALTTGHRISTLYMYTIYVHYTLYMYTGLEGRDGRMTVTQVLWLFTS